MTFSTRQNARGEGHTVPFFLVTQLADLVERWSIPRDELLSGSGLIPETPENPLRRVPLRTMCDLVVRAQLLTGEPGLGYYDGLRPPAAYGALGFAAMSASSVRDALGLALQFAPLFSTALSLSVSYDDAGATLCVEENADLGPARPFVIITMAMRLQTIFTCLTGQRRDFRADLALDEPPYQSRFAHLVPGWRFGRPAHRVPIDNAALDAAIVTADPTGLQIATAMCQRALDELGFGVGLIDGVCRLIAGEDGGFRTMDEVAQCLGVSGRTLKRRLSALGVSFSDLNERARREQATVLLRSSMSIADVAERLDYSTPSTFVRAFHRWTGTTPAAYRRRERTGGD